MKKFVKCFVAMLLMSAIIFCGFPIGENTNIETVYAAKLSVVSDMGKVVCKEKAQVLKPWWFHSYHFSSSNKKVATVNSRGILTAYRLGETRITIKDGSEKVTYDITVVPKKKSDVRLNQEILLTGQKVQLKLVSDKYDTSQVNLKFDSGFSEITSKGLCKGIKTKNTERGEILYWYGMFSKKTNIDVYPVNTFFSSMIRNYVSDSIPTDSNIDAGVEYTALTNKTDFFYKKNPTLAWARRKGLEFYLDGKKMPERVVYTPGEHILKIVADGKKYEQKINVGYSIKDALEKRDATGYSPKLKVILDAAFAAVDQVVKEGMTEEEKVRAIHDYLIYNADYVNNGDYRSAEKWAFGAEGVLLHKEGVCNSYAIAFYIMAKIAGLDCRYVTGNIAQNGNPSHAWNRVKVDGVWYYIDCTWDDPVGGGCENYIYYLSPKLWNDHIEEEEIDLVKKVKTNWFMYYLTGEDYSDPE